MRHPFSFQDDDPQNKTFCFTYFSESFTFCFGVIVSKYSHENHFYLIIDLLWSLWNEAWNSQSFNDNCFSCRDFIFGCSIFDVKHTNNVNASKNSLRIAINILSCKVKVSFYRTVYSSKESNDRRTKNRMSTDFTENKPRLVHLEDPFLQCWNMT